MHTRPLTCLLGLLIAMPLTSLAEEPAEDAVAKAIQAFNDKHKGITVNAETKSVDIDAKVCLRTGEFLEMFACTRDTREHESILVLDVKPSSIHLALLLLGQEPGKPLSYDRKFDPPKMVPATGPEVEIFVVRQIAGQERETPANRWVQDNKTGEVMKGNTWLFAGSVISEFQGEKAYLADVNGSAISLVNFGDDLLTLPNKLTQDNASHNKVWAPRSKVIPKVGTEVVLRLKVKAQAKEKGEAGDEAAQPGPDGEPTVGGDGEPAAGPEPGEAGSNPDE